MFPRHLFTSALLASLATGCAVGPDYHQPEAPVAAHYIGQSQTAPAGLPAADLASWWNGFNDPLLTHFIGLALAQNLDLAQTSARVAQARAGLGAANAALLPSGEINGSAARAHQSIETPIGKLLNATPAYNRWGDAYEADLGASWEIDVFGGSRREREAALADYQAAQAGVRAARLTVAAQTADIYISIRGLQARLVIAQQLLSTEQDLLAKTGLLLSKGLAAEYQVRQYEGELALVQASIPALRSRLETSMNALDVMLGAAPGTYRHELEAASSIPAAPQIDAMGSPADLLQRRPDLIVAERHVAAANARIGAAMAEYYPHFSLNALLGSATTVAGSNLFTSGASQASGVLGLRWRLFDFGRINAQIEQAKGQEAESLAAYRLAALHATEDVENAFSGLLNSKEQTTTLISGEASLSRARQSSYTAYQHGTASLIDVLHADQTLLHTADARAQAQTDWARAAVAAYKALGGGWQTPSETPTPASAAQTPYVLKNQQDSSPAISETQATQLSDQRIPRL